MTTSAERPSSAFDRLAEPIRRWAWQQGWHTLRDIQERAVDPILAGRDVVLASATASGKTEAAFLPLLSRTIKGEGLRIVYVSPLKALINDQSRRLEPLADAIGTTVTPWHGDVAGSRKRRLRGTPAGILLITPESLEAMFVTHGSELTAFFGGLDYVVIDELHSFIATERGRQLQSLMHRVELAIGRTVPRVGLSATLGDIRAAAGFLRPGAENAPRSLSQLCRGARSAFRYADMSNLKPQATTPYPSRWRSSMISTTSSVVGHTSYSPTGAPTSRSTCTCLSGAPNATVRPMSSGHTTEAWPRTCVRTGRTLYAPSDRRRLWPLRR